jgi:alcohol dehydrogenase
VREGVISELLAAPYADAMLVRLPEGVDPATAASIADNVSSAYIKVANYIPAVVAHGSDARVLPSDAELRRCPYHPDCLMR